MTVERVPVGLGDRAYDVVVGEGLLAEAGALIRPVMRGRRAVVVSDETVAALYLAPLRASLERAGIACTAIVVTPGEASKSFAALEDLLARLLDARPDRTTLVVALGGGVVGDLAGFAAAVCLRGLDYVQIPTTLLAQVDSSVGGKTAINTGHGKNLVGAFHQPRLVLADMASLATLPERELLAGYAEIVKYGLINDAAFFAWLEANAARMRARDGAALAHAVAVSCRAKAAVVAEDERETGRRALLNLGHTFAHALEAEAGYSGELLHGEAVAVGLVLAFQLSARLGLCAGEDAARVRRHIAAMGLPAGLGALGRTAADAPALLARMHHDKKARDGRLTFVLARGIGRAFVADDVAPGAVEALLASQDAA